MQQNIDYKQKQTIILNISKNKYYIEINKTIIVYNTILYAKQDRRNKKQS